MRFLALMVALGALTIAPLQAQAMENRLTVADVHNFVMKANAALNNPNMGVGRSFLNQAVASNALFENRTTHFNAPGAVHPVWYGSPYAGAYYRYPYYTALTPVSNRAHDKWDKIAAFENKKRLIHGYWQDMTVTGLNIRPYGEGAAVDIDLKEYSLGYAPHNPNLMTRVLHANSKCKMYLNKSRHGEVLLTRMDCNTNSSLPF